MNEQDLVDYTGEGFIVPIIRDDTKTYASVNAIMYSDEDGLEPEGNYFVYLLHPKRGSSHFTIEYDYDTEKWISRDAAAWIENDMVLDIVEQIKQRRNK
ncbi:MAG TPA: hypothetical protein VJU78_09970 [Chitinophagaceae bacterium]|nr:hypothetical protein [Chitinophagaceae bacterium]